MPVTQLTITPPTLPNPYCFTSWQQTANDLVGGAVVNFDVSGATVVLKQSGTPTASQRGFLWFNTTTGHTLRYDAGIGDWIAEYPLPPGDGTGIGLTMFWPGSSASIDTIGGGTAGVPTLISGPFWAISTAMAARFPLGAGTLPSGAVVAAGATGGAETTSLVQANLPNINVAVKTAIVGQAGVGGDVPVVGSTYGSDVLGGTSRAVDSTSTDLGSRYYTRAQTEPLGGGIAGAAPTAVNLLPPWYGGYWIVRTIRAYWTS